MHSFSQLYPPFIVLTLFIGLAVLLAVIRADRKDLPAIVRALMRVGSRDDWKNDPPSLPRPTNRKP